MEKINEYARLKSKMIMNINILQLNINFHDRYKELVKKYGSAENAIKICNMYINMCNERIEYYKQKN